MYFLDKGVFKIQDMNTIIFNYISQLKINRSFSKFYKSMKFVAFVGAILFAYVLATKTTDEKRTGQSDILFIFNRMQTSLLYLFGNLKALTNVYMPHRELENIGLAITGDVIFLLFYILANIMLLSLIIAFYEFTFEQIQDDVVIYANWMKCDSIQKSYASSSLPFIFSPISDMLDLILWAKGKPQSSGALFNSGKNTFFVH